MITNKTTFQSCCRNCRAHPRPHHQDQTGIHHLRTFVDHISHTHIQEDVECGTPKMGIRVPNRIVARWGKHVGNKQQTVFQYYIQESVKRANVSADELKKCYRFVFPTMSDGELFNLFKRAGFGQPEMRIGDRIIFVKEIMRRFQVMGGPVSLSYMPQIYVRLCLYVHMYFVVVHAHY